MKTPSSPYNVACVLIVALLSTAAFGSLVATVSAADAMSITPRAQDGGPAYSGDLFSHTGGPT